jgi:Big-like domain-containing protein
MIKRFAYAAALLLIVSSASIAPTRAVAQILPPPGSLIVTITSPASGSTVSSTITVTASVSIVGSLIVGGVQFKLDGANLGAEDTSAPYSASWNTAAAANGSHTLTAVARDLLGLQYSSNPVTVTVNNGLSPDTTPPSVAISSPANGATVSGTISVTANASDNVGVVGVQFKLDGVNLGPEDTAAPYSVPWDTTTTSNGSHPLTAVARDAAGNQTASAPVAVIVSNGPTSDTTPPSVAITSPLNGATVSGTVNVTASASDNVGVAGVQFFLDGVLRAEVTTAPYSVLWDTTITGNGSHTLTARARDAAGNTATSASVTVSVSNGSATVSRFEEDNAAVIASPSSAWVRRGPEVAAFSGGTAGSSDVPGATATFTFTGTAVSWIGLKCSVCGIATVSIDGGAATSVDTAGPAAPGSLGLTSEAVFTTSGLAAGSHTLVITVTGATTSGGGNIVVDAFDVTSTGSPATRIEDTDPAVSYIGPWVHGTDPRASGGTYAEVQVAGAVATLSFTGTGVRWLGYRDTNNGIARVSVDGAFVGEVDTYSPSPGLAVVFTATGLTSGVHTLTITVTGTKNPASSDTWVIIDAFDVSP